MYITSADKQGLKKFARLVLHIIKNGDVVDHDDDTGYYHLEADCGILFVSRLDDFETSRRSKFEFTRLSMDGNFHGFIQYNK